MTAFIAIADALARAARADIAASRARAAARDIGTRALVLGITDYRRQPNPDIDSHDWAVWIVAWSGDDWRRLRRLTASQSFEEALTSLGALSRERELPCID